MEQDLAVEGDDCSDWGWMEVVVCNIAREGGSGDAGGSANRGSGDMMAILRSAPAGNRRTIGADSCWFCNAVTRSLD
jgi:hypothetical protein